MPRQSPSTTIATAREDRVAAGLAYIFAIPAVIFLRREPYKHRPYVRYHCWQSVYFLIASLLIGIVLALITDTVPQLSFLQFDNFPLVSLLLVILWVVAMLKAFNGKRYKLPVVGEMAEKRARR